MDFDEFGHQFVALLPKLQLVAFQLKRNEHDAADLLQDLFLRCGQAIARGSAPENLEGWLVRSTKNLHLDGLRPRDTGRRLPLDAIDPALLAVIEPEAITDAPNPVESWAAAIDLATTPTRRQLLVAFLLEGDNREAIARRVNMDRKTLRTYLQRLHPWLQENSHLLHNSPFDVHPMQRTLEREFAAVRRREWNWANQENDRIAELNRDEIRGELADIRRFHRRHHKFRQENHQLAAEAIARELKVDHRSALWAVSMRLVFNLRWSPVHPSELKLNKLLPRKHRRNLFKGMLPIYHLFKYWRSEDGSPRLYALWNAFRGRRVRDDLQALVDTSLRRVLLRHSVNHIINGTASKEELDTLMSCE